jgi:hypothetical protein
MNATNHNVITSMDTNGHICISPECDHEAHHKGDGASMPLTQHKRDPTPTNNAPIGKWDIDHKEDIGEKGEPGNQESSNRDGMRKAEAAQVMFT